MIGIILFSARLSYAFFLFAWVLVASEKEESEAKPSEKVNLFSSSTQSAASYHSSPLKNNVSVISLMRYWAYSMHSFIIGDGEGSFCALSTNI